MFQGGVELNWLPPTEPNGEVHYVIEYKREDSENWTSVNTTSDSTHYNLTGLHSGANYTIRVVAVNSAGRATNRPTANNATLDVAVLVAGAVVVVLLFLILLTASVAVMVRRAQRKKQNVPNKVEEERESPRNTSREEQEEAEVAHHCEIVDQELNCETGDVLAQLLEEGSLGEATGINSTGDYYDIIDGQSVLSKPEVGHGTKENGQQTDKPKRTPNVVYAVVDKSKKKKPEKTEGGQSTIKGHFSEEQHYERSSLFGQDWLGDVKCEGNRGDGKTGCLSSEAKETGPQSEPCKPNAVYAVVDKSKKKSRGKTHAPALVDKAQMENISEDEFEPLMQRSGSMSGARAAPQMELSEAHSISPRST